MKKTSVPIQLIELIWRGKAGTRADIARALNLSRPTISVLVEKFIDNEILEEMGTGLSTGGKPPVILELKSETFYSIGIDVGFEDVVHGVLLDAKNNIVEQVSASGRNDFESIVETITALIKQLDNGKISGCGIGVSAIVIPDEERIVKSSNFDLTEKPLLPKLRQELAMPLYIDNRSRMSARSEQLAGAADDAENFALISLGKSIGSALYINGNLYTGSNGMAGEIRSLLVSSYDGKTFQTLENAISSSVQKRHGVTDNDLARRCAEGLKQMLAFYDVDTLILSGRFADFGKDFLDTLKHEITREFKCNVIPSCFGNYGPARGAAIAAVEKLIMNTTKKSLF